MAYEKQTWTTGEVITKEKLNHMEDGIANGGGVLLLNVDTAGVFDKTWNEINTALRNGQLVFALEASETFVNWLFVGCAGIGRNNTYNLTVLDSEAKVYDFETDDPNDYPVKVGDE